MRRPLLAIRRPFPGPSDPAPTGPAPTAPDQFDFDRFDLSGDLVRSAAIWLIVAAAAAAGGCAASADKADPVAESRSDTVGAAPRDLTIEVTVLAGPGAERLDRVERRQGRYILFPDGGLHADVGRTIDAKVRPGLSRRLEVNQVDSVWLVARSTGLASPENGGPAGNDAMIEAPPGQIVHIVTFIGNDRSWRFVRTAPAQAEQDPSTTALIRELAALAWIPDDPVVALRPAVVRYDFGPDPYAMFRPPATARDPIRPFFWVR